MGGRVAFALLVGLLVAAGGYRAAAWQGAPDEAEVHNGGEGAATSGLSMSEGSESTAGLPAELQGVQPLWEEREGRTPSRPEAATRLYEDGRLYTWSDVRRRVVDGKETYEPAPYAWRLEAALRPEGVERVRELIRTGFVQLPERTGGALASDQGLTTRRSFLDGAAHEVSTPSGSRAGPPPAIGEINDVIARSIIPGAVPAEN
jgi:hypothetical protein